MTDKKCSSCEDILIVGKNWTEAQAKKSTYKCSPCKAAYQRDYHKDNRKERLLAQKQHYKDNKEEILIKQREYYIRKTFDISVEQYDAYLEHPCNICGKDEDKVLDHCHKSGMVRGALCRQCNSAIGLLKEDPIIIKNALDYINKERENWDKEQIKLKI